MNHKPLSLIMVITLTNLALGACQSDQQDAQEELQSLLRDEPLPHVLPGMATASKEISVSTAKMDSIHSGIILPTANPVGIWDFDDCTPERTNLSDASFDNNTAFRSVGVACTEGIQGSTAVAISAVEDIVYVPDQPNFTFENGVTVAGWFKPAAITGTNTLFRKRDKNTSSFALLLNGGRFEFIVNLGDDHAISVISPQKAKVGVFQHVAATYDGFTARLYIDGLEINNFSMGGSIPLGAGPLLMGNDGSERRFAGAIDSTVFATHAFTADEVLALNCFLQEPTIVLTPDTLTTTPGVPTTLDIAITNHNSAACAAPLIFTLENFFSQTDQLALDPSPFTSLQSAPVPSGSTGHMTITATPGDMVEPGTSFSFDIEIFEPTTNFGDIHTVNVTVNEPIGCHVSAPRELMITNISVVDDPVRTVFNPTSQDPRNGVWTFKHLMENMAPSPADAPAMVETMLRSFTTSQTINGFTIAPRPLIQGFVLDGWPRTPNGELDLARAPLLLLAITNRFDLRDLANGDAGEAHFVFSFHFPSNPFFSLDATMTFDYKLPATTDQDAIDWAQSFHALGAMQFGEKYNATLQAITERFAGRGVRPGYPNGSAIHSVRTHESEFGRDGIREMRQFNLSPTSGRLEPAALALTPDRSFNNSSTLASYINANQVSIIAETNIVPDVFAGLPFQAGAVLDDRSTWFAPDVDNEARHHFALNTCNGCHGSVETSPFFPSLQISPRRPGAVARLSEFLTGITVPDPVTGQPRTFNDLHRRSVDLKTIVCAEQAALSGELNASLRKGIQRVH